MTNSSCLHLIHSQNTKKPETEASESYSMFRQVGSITRSAVFLRFSSTAYYNAALAELKKDLKRAMISKDELRKTTIRSLLSSIKNKEIDNKGKPLDEFALFDLYSKLVNQRQESIREFIKNKREDLVAKEEQEMSVIEEYVKALPVASKEEIDGKVLQLLQDLKKEEPNLQLKQIFGKVDWKTINAEWMASPNAVKTSVVQLFKHVFG